MPRLGDLEVELVRAESDKYAAPLLLLHGLWTSPRIWRPAATYWSHRGWNCYAPAWRGPAATTWSGALESVQQVAAALPRPIAIGHDLGALLALALDDTSAAVAIAPPAWGASAPPHPLSRSLRARAARWRAREYVPREAEAQRLLGLGADLLSPEPSSWWNELTRVEVPSRPRAKRLLVAGERDVLLPASIETDAAALGAEILRYPDAGHDLPYGPRWQAIVADVHRWVVRRLGSDLLLLRGDEDLVDE